MGGLSSPSPAQSIEARIGKAIELAIAKQGVTDSTPGVAVCVIQPGRYRVSRFAGLADMERKGPINGKTVFELASVTKPITATGILILKQRGALSLEDDIRKWLPEMPDYPRGTIRISDLLHHTSGLPEYMSFENVPTTHSGYWTKDDYLPAFEQQRKEHPLVFRPRKKYLYTNSNYMLLAAIAERASKKPFAEFMREAVFQPAGMKETFVYDAPEAIPSTLTADYVRAVGYLPQEGQWNAAWGLPPVRQETLLTTGDGAIWTTLDDMADWDLAIRKNKLVTKETMKAALTCSKTEDGQTNGYGHGWELYPGDGVNMYGFGHGGSWGGFRTMYYLDLLNDRTTIVLSNREDFNPDSLWDELQPFLNNLKARRR